jgi:hypothetical protein
MVLDERILYLLEFEPPTVQPLDSPYTVYAVPETLR